MSCMRAPILEEASVEEVPEAAICSDPAQVLDLDLNTCCVDDTQFNTNFTLNITRDCNLTAIVGYFDTYFDLPQKPVMFSTGMSNFHVFSNCSIRGQQTNQRTDIV